MLLEFLPYKLVFSQYCGAEIGLSRQNSRVAFVVRRFNSIFPTMASTAGREIMNSEVAGSIPNVIPIRKGEKEIEFRRQNSSAAFVVQHSQPTFLRTTCSILMQTCWYRSCQEAVG